MGQRARIPTRAQRRADALGIIAESFLKHGAQALNGGERQQIVVHVEAETLQQRSAGRCELETGPSLLAETARRLACDASVVRIVENAEGEPLDVGRKTRSIPSAIRRALKARDQGCRVPGCTHRRYVDGHHIEHWAEGGETKLRNLVSLCRFHHRLVHEGGIRIGVLDDGALQFLKPDGELFEDENPEIGRVAGDWRALVAAHRQQALAIDAGNGDILHSRNEERTRIPEQSGRPRRCWLPLTPATFGLAANGCVGIVRSASCVVRQSAGAAALMVAG